GDTPKVPGWWTSARAARHVLQRPSTTGPAHRAQIRCSQLIWLLSEVRGLDGCDGDRLRAYAVLCGPEAVRPDPVVTLRHRAGAAGARVARLHLWVYPSWTTHASLPLRLLLGQSALRVRRADEATVRGACPPKDSRLRPPAPRLTRRDAAVIHFDN